MDKTKTVNGVLMVLDPGPSHDDRSVVVPQPKPAKRPYSPPTLILLGTASHMTRGGGGASVDAMATDKMSGM